MGTINYSIANLEHCINNLFANAETELESLHNFKEEFSFAIKKDIPKTIRVFSRWENDEDCFSATSLTFWRIEGSKLLIELAVYDRFSGYKATNVVHSCTTPDEVFEWLKESGSITSCLETAVELISMLD